jgi:hypothetical protein
VRRQKNGPIFAARTIEIGTFLSLVSPTEIFNAQKATLDSGQFVTDTFRIEQVLHVDARFQKNFESTLLGVSYWRTAFFFTTTLMAKGLGVS